MTNTTARQEHEPLLLLEAWSAALSQVLMQLGVALQCAVFAEAPADLTPDSNDDLWIVCVCSGGLRGEMSLRLSPGLTLRFGQILMSEPIAAEDELTPDHREAAIELLRQVSGLVATAIQPHWGEVQLRLNPAAGPPSWPAASKWWLRVGNGSSAATLVEAQLSAALEAAMRTEQTTCGQPAPAAIPEAPAPDAAGKLDMLMDVELAVTLRFGSRRLLLRDILSLNPGAVIELDRQVSDPVDLLLAGRLLARGEVVVVDGNYGLRVTEVAANTVL